MSVVCENLMEEATLLVYVKEKVGRRRSNKVTPCFGVEGIHRKWRRY